MVRFIIMSSLLLYVLIATIYIPIWLDLLYNDRYLGYKAVYDLHSNMVRFIISMARPKRQIKNTFTFQYG